VTPATLTSFIGINENAQLRKFGLHNGAPNDRNNNLSEKWEGIALVPARDPKNPYDFFCSCPTTMISSRRTATRRATPTRTPAARRR